MAAAANTSKVKADALRTVRVPGWQPVEVALAAMLLCSFAIVPWMGAAYTPAVSGEARVSPGMSRKEVLVILGEPNQRQAQDVCWNYDRLQDGKDRVCIRFNEAGRVVSVAHDPHH